MFRCKEHNSFVLIYALKSSDAFFKLQTIQTINNSPQDHEDDNKSDQNKSPYTVRLVAPFNKTVQKTSNNSSRVTVNTGVGKS